MTRKSIPVCSEHKVKKVWRSTTFEYRERGIVVRIPNVPAWICPSDGEASYMPETTDELITTVKELIATAKRAKARRVSFTEYVVAVGR